MWIETEITDELDETIGKIADKENKPYGEAVALLLEIGARFYQMSNPEQALSKEKSDE